MIREENDNLPDYLFDTRMQSEATEAAPLEGLNPEPAILNTGIGPIHDLRINHIQPGTEADAASG